MGQLSIPIFLLAVLCFVAFVKSHTALLSAPMVKVSFGNEEKEPASDVETGIVKRRLRGDFVDPFRIRPSIILFGDSMTEISFGHPGNHDVGFGSLVAAAYSRRADVLNRGFAGYNTKWAVDQLLPSVFTGPVATTQQKVNPAASESFLVQKDMPSTLFVTVMFGTNDMSDQGSKAHVHIREYGQNLNTIVEYIKNTTGPHTPIVMMTPPPFSPKLFMEAKGRDSPGHSNTRARAYGFKVKQVAKEHNLALVDTWHLLEGTSGEENFGPKYLYDGMHPNDEGNRIIFKGIMSALEERYPEVLPMKDGMGRYGTKGIPMEGELSRRIK